MDLEKYEPILKHVARNVQLTEEEKVLFTSIIKTSRVKKRQFVIQPGYPCNYRNYIVKGAFRMFHLDHNGKEQTISIGIEDWFFTDIYSHVYKKPSKFFAEALEDSIIFQMSYEDVEKLCQQSHAISQYWRMILEKSYANSRNRIVSNMGKTSEERYWEYANRYPEIINRVPQYVIASYLGMSAEFLSKIRARPIKKS